MANGLSLGGPFSFSQTVQFICDSTRNAHHAIEICKSHITNRGALSTECSLGQ